MEISVENLKFAYGAKKVLNGINITFKSGKIYGIAGKNGAGKTTFFKALTNIITNYAGEVSFDGENVRQKPSLLAKTGILLDDIELYKAYSGWFNVRYFAGLRGYFDEEKTRKLAQELDIVDNLSQKVSTYSLGMTKKLLLLISLMNDAQVLIFDEPLRGIDAKAVLWFRNYLLDLKNQGKLILLSSHVQEDIEALCDEVFVLSDGQFSARFDLNDDAQVLTYKVTVSEPSVFCELLSNEGLIGKQEQNAVEFTCTNEKFQDIFKLAVARDLVFEEIRKEAQFVRYVK